MNSTKSVVLVFVLLLGCLLNIVQCIEPCQLLKTKTSQYADVTSSLDETQVMLKSLGALKGTTQQRFTSESISEQLVSLDKTQQELMKVQKELEIHMAALELLCPRSGGVATSPSPASPASPVSPVAIMKVMNTPTSIPTVDVANNVPTIVDNATLIGDGLSSCKEYQNQMKSSVSGLYWIKPNSTTPRYIVYCEQQVAGGGWILVSTRTNKSFPKLANIVKPDYSGDSMMKEKWSYWRDNGKEFLLKDPSGKYAIADMNALRTPGICRPLSYDLTNCVIYHREDSGCEGTGMDYCLLGASPDNKLMRSPEIFRYCSKKPHTVYQFEGGASYLTESNFYVR